MQNEIPYNREAAVIYAHEWAFDRNPKYVNFDDMGGDCTNFISQALHAGGAIMNTTPDVGWYFHSLNDRAAAWTSVPYLYKFLTANRDKGPFGHEVPVEEVEPGDIIQLHFANKDDYSHSLLVEKVGDPPSPDNILVAAHSYDADLRPLSTYSYVKARGIHIDGVRL